MYRHFAVLTRRSPDYVSRFQILPLRLEHRSENYALRFEGRARSATLTIISPTINSKQTLNFKANI